MIMLYGENTIQYSTAQPNYDGDNKTYINIQITYKNRNSGCTLLIFKFKSQSH